MTCVAKCHIVWPYFVVLGQENGNILGCGKGKCCNGEASFKCKSRSRIVNKGRLVKLVFYVAHLFTTIFVLCTYSYFCVKYRILHIILLYVLFQKVNRLFIVKKKNIIRSF